MPIISPDDDSLAYHPDPSAAPSLRTSSIEVDTFCTHCHYNLHGQVVTIDERLKIPVCRCPECGTFHPAGVGVTASGVWVRRAATGLLLVWIAIVVTGMISFAAAMFPLQVGSVEAYTEYHQTPTASYKYHYHYTLRDWKQAGTSEYNGFDTMASLSTASVTTGLILGVLIVTLMWHWRRWRYFFTLILPVIPALIAMQIYRTQPEYEWIVRQCIERAFSQAGIQIFGMLIGLLIGRKISRNIILLVIPPKPRQALAFLWKIDGYTPPES